ALVAPGRGPLRPAGPGGRPAGCPGAGDRDGQAVRHHRQLTVAPERGRRKMTATAPLETTARFTNRPLQMLCVWCGPAMVFGWIASFVLLAGFIPPPSPDLTPEQLVALYSGHTGVIRLGLMLTMFASALLVPFAAVISAQMRRIEGDRAVLAPTQLISGGLLALEFILPLMVWQTAAYRPEISPVLVRLLNDMGWL